MQQLNPLVTSILVHIGMAHSHLCPAVTISNEFANNVLVPMVFVHLQFLAGRRMRCCWAWRLLCDLCACLGFILAPSTEKEEQFIN